MTDFDRLPYLTDDLAELMRGRRKDFESFDPSAYTTEPDGTVQATDGLVVGGGAGTDPDAPTEVSGAAPAAPSNLSAVPLVGNGVLYADVEWTVDTTDPNYSGITGWQVDWVPNGGGQMHRRTTQDTGLEAITALRHERIEPLLPATLYDVRVRAVTAVGTPGATATVQVTTGELEISDATFRDVYVTGEFDTSEQGTSAGVHINGTDIDLYAVGGTHIGTLRNDSTQVSLTAEGTGFPGTLTLSGAPTATDTAKFGAGGCAIQCASGSVLILSNAGSIKLEAALGVMVGLTGTPIFRRIVWTDTFDPPSLAANTTSTWTFTKLGVQAGDVVTMTQGLHGTNAGVVFMGAVASTDTVTVHVRNITGAAIDIGNRTFGFICEGLS